MARCRLAFGFGLAMALWSGVAAAMPLITDEEAQLPGVPPSKISRGISRGPTIRSDLPEAVVAHKPFDFKIEFEAHGQATIDPAKVHVTYLKVPGIDLTERIRPFISATGIMLPNAEVPPGQHPLRIEVEDSGGRTSEATLVLTAEKSP